MATIRRMLIDATHSEETRVAVIDQNLKLEHLDIVHAGREPLKGNIYLAKVKRIEPSLQAAFVEYDEDGVKRHGFLSFAEIHPDYFRIPTDDRNRLREALARIEEKAAEAAARGETLNIDAIAGFGSEFANSRSSVDANGDEDDSYDPFMPISLSDDDDDQDFHAPISLMDAPRVRTSSSTSAPADAPLDAAIDADSGVELAEQEAELTAEDNSADTSGDTQTEAATAEVGETVAPAFAKSYETIGGDDDLEEQRRRIRRQFLRHYRIQEVIKRGQVMLIQVVKEERGNKGAALTTYISLAGRYCVLMPNSDKSGGVSRKISNPGDRRRLKETMELLEAPEGMSVILRTAGVERTSDEIKRDFDYLLRLWDQIRETTMQSTAPALIYEEANLIKRAIRDHFTRDMDAIVVEGERSFKLAQDFMKLLMPSHIDRVVQYQGTVPLFTRFQIETHIEQLYEPIVQLKSGGYLVINPTEALVSIDVNSGRATRDRHIEETALRTNMEAAEEVARQLRLRDLAGLVVIDFIDMEDYRHNNQVERKLKEAMKHDRARLQIGRISGFGLMELSRQRLRPSLLETNFEHCPHCANTGHIRSADSAALSVLRAIEDEGIKQKAVEIAVDVPTDVALYILNSKRAVLSDMEQRYAFRVYLRSNDELLRHEFKVERLEQRMGEPVVRVAISDTRRLFADTAAELGLQPLSAEDLATSRTSAATSSSDEDEEGTGTSGRANTRGRSRRRGGRNRDRQGNSADAAETAGSDEDTVSDESDDEAPIAATGAESAVSDEERRRRRGRRGGRRRGGREGREGRDTRAPQSNDNAAGNDAHFFAEPTVVEIDTTPKAHVVASDVPGTTPEKRERGPRQRRPQQDRPQQDRSRQDNQQAASAPVSSDSQPNGEPKSGWWRRWTGA